MRSILLLTLIFPVLSLQAQLPDSITYNAELQFALSNQDYLAQWALANRYGILADQSADGYLLGGIHAPYSADSSKFKVAFGLDYLLKPNLGDSRLQQAYARAKFYFIELSAGRFERTVGVHNPELSTGSLAISRNARPMPVVQLGVPEYTDVPFTKGYLSFKGHLLHGWFEEDRHVSNTLLHEKALYLKIGPDSWPVSVYGGLVHFAQWGGTRPNGSEQPAGFDDYWRVFTGREAAEQSDGGEFVNALGNHLGILDLGITLNLRDLEVHLYQQDPFEDRLSLSTDFVLYDQLLGVNIKPKRWKYFTGLVYEYLNTTHQGGPGIPDPRPGDDPNDLSPNYGYEYGGRDDYYNNYLYQSGWTYQGNILGNPLLLTRNRLLQFVENIPAFRNGEATANNRIIGHHLGLQGQLGSKKLRYKVLTTYTRNFGTYAGLNDGRYEWASREPGYENYPYAFKSSRYQMYTLAEATYQLGTILPLQILTSAAYDFGELYHNFTLMIGIRSHGVLSKKKHE